MNVIFLTVTIQRSKAGMSPRVEPTKVVEGHSRPGDVMIAGYPVGQTTAWLDRLSDYKYVAHQTPVSEEKKNYLHSVIDIV